MQINRNPDALLAGVCQRIAQTFRWNVWAVRAVFVLVLLTKTLVAVIIYGVLALLIEAADRYRGNGRTPEKGSSLASRELSSHNRRIEALDQRFRKWEESIKD